MNRTPFVNMAWYAMILLSRKGFHKINFKEIHERYNKHLKQKYTKPVSQVAQQDDTFIVL